MIDQIKQKLGLKHTVTSIGEEIEAYLSLGPLSQQALSEGLIKFSAVEIIHAGKAMGMKDFTKNENDKVIAELVNSTNKVLIQEALSLK